MQYIIAVILWTYLLGQIPDLLFSGYESWYVALYARDVQCALWIALIFQYIPKKKIFERTVCLAFFIYVVTEAQMYFVNKIFGYGIYDKSYLIYTVIIIAFLSYQLLKPYKYESDIITENSPNIFLCFWTPSKGMNLLPSLLGLPFGGMCIYSQGLLYGFEWSKKTYQIREVPHYIIKNKFVIHDTQIAMNTIIFNMLQNLYGIEAGRFRVRCIGIIAPVLNLMGSKYRVKGILDRIPSIKAAEILSR